jgi:hypothetical protein
MRYDAARPRISAPVAETQDSFRYSVTMHHECAGLLFVRSMPSIFGPGVL